MDDPPQTTEAAYRPDSELRDLLTEVLETACVEYGDQRPFSIPVGDTEAEGLSIDYELTFEDPEVGTFTLDGTETYSPIGVIMSLSGHLGLAASVALAQAFTHGDPTQAYLDEAPPPEWPPSADPYQDLTVEWYPPAAADAGLPEARLEKRVSGFEHEEIAISKLEHYARMWLSAGG